MSLRDLVPDMSLELPLTELKKKRQLPDRYPQREIFLCDVGDAVIKDDMASMEHPIFALSTKPDHEAKRYQHGDITVDVEPSMRGLATIWDKDILIFAISQIMAAKNEGRPYSRDVVFSARDLLVFTNRMTNGGGYEGLKDALARLDGTRVRTTISTGGEQSWKAFGLIDGAMIRRRHHDGRVIEWGVTLSEWLFRAIEANEVLTLDPSYFRLRKSIDRRVYEVARKHCGEQKSWKIRLELLLKKSGSKDTLKKFRYNIRELERSNVLPTYSVKMVEGDCVLFERRETKNGITDAMPRPLPVHGLSLRDSTYEIARDLLDGWDARYVEQQWRNWTSGKGIEVQKPDAHFIKFCQSWVEKNGRP